MIPVDAPQLRRLTDLTSIESTNAAIRQVPEAERAKFIEDHRAEYRALRQPLWLTGQMKCWYSEARLQEGEGHVEHYRPKGRLAGATHAGYWWRAFDWRNFRIAHPTVNLRKTDYLRKVLAGKGSYFPLRDNTPRASNADEEPQEQPVLLDPVIPADCNLLTFSEESGAPRPRYSKEADPWRHQRAADSIEFYHLNEGTWNAARADLMAAVKVLCGKLLEIADSQPVDQAAYDEKIGEIVRFLSPYAEFSAACRQVVEDRVWEHLPC